MSTTNEINPEESKKNWELRGASACKRDLALKKLAVGTIALLNLAAVGVAFYFIISYCPVPSEAYIVSPFVLGVVGALTYLKFPTCGINQLNYTQYSNPLVILGKGLTYILFGPYMYVFKKCDWTTYHDPETVGHIAELLRKEGGFEELIKEYGKHFGNLVKYGIIPSQFKEDCINFYKQYLAIEEELHSKYTSHREKFETKKQEILTEWHTLQEQISPYLFFPEVPERTQTGRKIYQLFCGPPF